VASNGHRSGGGRPATSNEIIINASGGETRVALLEGGNFTELHIERERDRNVAGMVAKGRVTRVLPGMQAGFVDIGLEKAAFLYVGDYLDDEGLLDGEDEDAGARFRRGQRQVPRIETLLRKGAGGSSSRSRRSRSAPRARGSPATSRSRGATSS
jgi:Ribonuclease G/E